MKIKVFGLNSSKEYADKVCQYLQISRSKHTSNHFDDGENYLKSNENVRDADVFVISSLHSDEIQSVNEKLVELLWFVGSLRDASAGRITVVAPYLGYARQDRKTESRAPITTKYLAKVLEAVGVDRVLTIDVHNLASFQNSFRIPVDNLAATRLFIDHLTGCPSFPRMIKDHYHRRKQEFLDLDLVVLSPDIGGMPRCGLFQRALAKRISEICQRPPKEIPLAIFDKTRVDGEVRGSRIIGNVKDKDVLILDDLIASGSTVAKAYDAVVSEGGRVYAICATHGQFTSKKLVADKSLIVTDTVTQIPVGFSNLDVISTIQFVGEAIQRTNSGGSISDLLEC